VVSIIKRINHYWSLDAAEYSTPTGTVVPPRMGGGLDHRGRCRRGLLMERRDDGDVSDEMPFPICVRSRRHLPENSISVVSLPGRGSSNDTHIRTASSFQGP
jgi:hypothetical protein